MIGWPAVLLLRLVSFLFVLMWHSTAVAGECEGNDVAVLILVDVTTTFDDVDRTILRESMLTIFSSLNEGEFLAIRTVTASFATSERLVLRCTPYCPPENWWQSLFSNCTEGRLAEDRRHLAAELRTVLTDLLETPRDYDRSDILRTLKQASAEEAAGWSGIRLYIFSDMIENSDFLGARKFLEQSTHTTMKTLRELNLVGAFPNSRIWIFGFGRFHGSDHSPLTVGQQKKLTDFWTEYFKESGAQDNVTLSQNLTYRD